MKSVAHSLTIKTKLSLVILIVMAGLLILSAFALYTEKTSLLEDRQVKTRHLVESAHTVLSHFYDQQTKGVLTEEQAKAAAMGVIKALRYQEKEYFWINDMTPRVVMHPMKPELDGKDVSEAKDPTGKKLFVEFVEVVKKDGAGFVAYMWPKPGFDKPVQKISYVKGFAPWGWVVGSGIYIDDIETIFWNTTRWMIGIIVVLSLIVFVMLQIIIRSITRPLSDIQNAIRRIQTSKDLSQRVAITRHDEIGDIGDSFNQMVESFQQIIHRVIEGVIEVQKSSSQLYQSSNRVSESSQKQSDAAASMAAATEEMLTSIEHVAENSRHTYNIANQSGELSSQGERAASDTAVEMSKIADAVNLSSVSITQLGEESKQISDIVKTIKEIADQTNLLALNAAIEAARAGEQGRGFAVVADEVRKLAERTSKSTVEITSMIEKIQSETNDAVAGMQEGTARVKGGVEMAEQAGRSMADIRAGAQKVLSSVNEITTALSEQSSAGGQVAQGVEQIAQMADENATAVNEIAVTAERLAHLADSLTEAVTQFKA
ncbi:MAG: methyl-accepting chemotaxis protein [Gallionellaceae bacterium]